jgi:hypothetical protein
MRLRFFPERCQAIDEIHVPRRVRRDVRELIVVGREGDEERRDGQGDESEHDPDAALGHAQPILPARGSGVDRGGESSDRDQQREAKGIGSKVGHRGSSGRWRKKCRPVRIF